MRILLIEDDAVLGAAVRDQIAADGQSVDWVGRLDAAGDAMAAASYDLVLLDLMLPDGRGIGFLKALRTRGDVTPVVILTALDQVSDRIEGLNAGADDYLVKPFEPKELLLRINAILRRVPAAEPVVIMPKVLHMGPVRYDIERGEMWHGDDLVRLTATESQLMRIFSGRPGEAVTRSLLVEELSRSGGQTQERAVDVQITRLRRKIETDPKQPRYLQTVRGSGYMLAPE